MQKSLVETYLDVCLDNIIGESTIDKTTNFKKILKVFVDYVVGELGITKKDFTISIRKFTKKDNESGGYISVNKSSKSTDKIKVNINNSMLPKNILIILGHELTHVKQRKNGELVIDYDNKNFLWNGKPFISFDDYKNITREDYNNLPWEAEALKKQVTFLEKFKLTKPFLDLKRTDDINMELVLSII